MRWLMLVAAGLVGVLVTVIAFSLRHDNEQHAASTSAAAVGSDAYVAPARSVSPDLNGSTEKESGGSQSSVAAATVQDSAAAPLLQAVQQPYDRPEDKRIAVLAAMRNSGAAPSPFSAQGAELARAFSSAGYIADWNCHMAGCVYQVSKQAPESLSHVVVSMRDKAAPGYVMVITPEPVPDKLILLLNYKDSEP